MDRLLSSAYILLAYCPPWFAAVGVLLFGAVFVATWWTVAMYIGVHDSANDRFERQQAQQAFATGRRFLAGGIAVLFLWLTVVSVLTHIGPAR